MPCASSTSRIEPGRPSCWNGARDGSNSITRSGSPLSNCTRSFAIEGITLASGSGPCDSLACRAASGVSRSDAHPLRAAGSHRHHHDRPARATERPGPRALRAACRCLGSLPRRRRRVGRHPDRGRRRVLCRRRPEELHPDRHRTRRQAAGRRVEGHPGGLPVHDGPFARRRAARWGDAARRQRVHPLQAGDPAINGICAAGGLEMMWNTDLRVCADTAWFQLAEPRRGLFPGGGSTVQSVRQLTWCHAMEVVLLAERISAARAHEMGLVNRVVPRDRVLAEARKLAETICLNGPLAVRACKRSAKESTFLPLKEALANEMSYSASVFMSEDAKEGIKAFKEKRPPVWRGR